MIICLDTLAFLSFSPGTKECCASFARSTQANYSTQALSISEFNVVKQTDGIELHTNEVAGCNESPSVSSTIAGKGIVNVKRSVHGYKKLSLVHRNELSRTSIILPQMEFGE